MYGNMLYISENLLQMAWETIAKWRDEFVQQAFNMAQLGLTDEQIAKVFNVAIDTLNGWKNEHEGFYESLANGRTLIVSQAAGAMFKSAIGFEYEETIETVQPDGKITTVTYKKYAKPNPYAGKFILSCRQRDIWSERSESIHTNINIAKLDISSLSPELLQVIEREQRKQLTENAGHN
jgi:hypothetical protein